MVRILPRPVTMDCPTPVTTPAVTTLMPPTLRLYTPSGATTLKLPLCVSAAGLSVPLGQVGFIHGQLSGLDLQAIEGDRVIRRIDWRWWRKRIQCPTVVAVDVPLAQVKVGQLGDTETCRRETGW
jgi:hypothetical protein